MRDFGARCRERVGGPPNLKDFIDLMLDEDMFQKQNQSRRNENVSAAMQPTPDPSARPSRPRFRGQRRGRDIARRRHGNPQQPRQQQQHQQQQQQHQQHHQQQQHQQQPRRPHVGGRGRGMPYSRPGQQWGHRPITCTKCLSTNGSHTAANCWSKGWCGICQSASHDLKNCRINRK